MARFCTLFSGSSGNCAYAGGSDGGVLIDVGRSCKQLLAAMEQSQIAPDAVHAILITHEHTDHISGLRVLQKKLKVPVFATSEVLEYIQWHKGLEPAAQVCAVVPGETYTAGPLIFDCFDTPHDSVHSVGYRLTTPDGRKIAVATDMGYIDNGVMGKLTGCDCVLLESNYDRNMLSVCAYPYQLKQRIASNTGHLSNEDCASALCGLVRGGSTRFLLGHLSQNANMPILAKQTALNAFFNAGMRENIDFQLRVAPRDAPSEMILL